jgi:hypothetical protein
VSSFDQSHHIYLFEMRNGRRKLAYGSTPEDALDILRTRLTAEEMSEIMADRFVRVRQRDLQAHIDSLG